MDATETDVGTTDRAPFTMRRLLAYAVHAFTASGAVLGVLALLAVIRGDLPTATVYMLVALFIDSVDGSIARRVDVSFHAPTIDGRRLDDIVDYLNFVIVPVVFMIQAGSLLTPALVALPVISSAFGFSRRDAKTDDDFFLGWPSYWNVLAFYLWLLDLSPLAGSLWVVGLAIAVFVPWKYIYPSKLENRILRYGVSYSGLLWAIAIGYAALAPESAARFHVLPLSLGYPAVYVGLSIWLGRWARD